MLETAAGLANVFTPNIWKLPIAELESRRSVTLAASAVLVPHWGGLARSGAGLVCVALAAWQEGIGLASAGLVPLALALAVAIVGVSALLARAGVAKPEVDVVQFSVRWGKRHKDLAPISIGASVFQFLLSIATIPAAKLLSPSVLYQPEIGPSGPALLVTVAASVALAPLVYVAWSSRIAAAGPSH